MQRPWGRNEGHEKREMRREEGQRQVTQGAGGHRKEERIVGTSCTSAWQGTLLPCEGT